MRWYDYIAACWFAFHLWVALIYFDVFVLIIGVFSFLLYENSRKEIEDARNN